MPKRDLSPDSRKVNERPFQQQKSISDIIGPMVDQCHLDLEQNESLSSLAKQYGAANQQQAEHGESFSSAVSKRNSTGSSRQNSSEGEGFNSLDCEQGMNPDEVGYTDPDGVIGDAVKAGVKAAKKKGKKMVKAAAVDIEGLAQDTWEIFEGAAKDIEDTVDSGLDVFGTGLNVTTGVFKSCVTGQVRTIIHH